MPDLGSAALIDTNLQQAMRFFGEATGLGSVQDQAGITIIDSGIDYAVFNISVFRGPLVASPLDFHERLCRPEAHFRDRIVRWSHWVCLDLLPPAVRARADDAFRLRGLRRLTEAPAMIAKRLIQPSWALPVLRCRRVDDLESRTAFAHITSMSFDIPFPTCYAVYTPPGAWAGSYRGYLGYMNNAPVTTVAVVPSDEVIGVYSVGTLPGYRRRGCAEALLRTVLAEVSRETKVFTYVLQSTRAGYELYRRMGFDTVGKFAVFVT